MYNIDKPSWQFGAQWLSHAKCQDITPPEWNKGEWREWNLWETLSPPSYNLQHFREASIKSNLLVISGCSFLKSFFLSFQHEKPGNLSSVTGLHWVMAHLLLSLCKRCGLHTRLMVFSQKTHCPSLLSYFSYHFPQLFSGNPLVSRQKNK